MQHHFQNELGNSISLEVREEDIEGVSGVHITIIGPTSTSENHLTRLEAKTLYEALGSLFEK